MPTDIAEGQVLLGAPFSKVFFSERTHPKMSKAMRKGPSAGLSVQILHNRYLHTSRCPQLHKNKYSSIDFRMKAAFTKGRRLFTK